MTQTLSREKLLKHIQVAEGMENLGGGSEAERDLLTLYRMALASLDGNVKRHTMERLESFVSGTKGKRLTYKALIA